VFSLAGRWLSGRIALISGRLPRSWPNVAGELRLPHWVLGLLALACLASLLPGTVGFGGQLLLAALLGTFLVQGFAVVHFLSRGSGGRSLILAFAYFVTLFLSWLVLPLAILLGLADTFFNLRGRFGGRSNSQRTPR
jgi:Predicted membrane protein (DUF2232)